MLFRKPKNILLKHPKGRFSLSTMFGVVAAIAVVLGVCRAAYHAALQKHRCEHQAMIAAVKGGLIIWGADSTADSFAFGPGKSDVSSHLKAHPESNCDMLQMDNVKSLNDSLVDELRFLTHLKCVMASDSCFDDRVLRSISHASGLRYLSIGGTKVTDEGIIWLRSLSNLENLYLADNDVSDSGIVALASLAKLRQLSLCGTQVTDRGLSCLAAKQSIKHLDLSATTITDKGAEVLSQMNWLETLNISETKISDEGLENLQRKLPNTKIIADRRT